MYVPGMPKIIVFLGTVSLILLYILLFYAGYLVFWPTKSLVVNNPIMKVDTPVVKRGDALIYDFNYCRYDIFGATIYRTVYGDNNIIYLLAAVNTVTYPGCRNVKIYLMIPATIPPGTYHVEMLVNVQVNLLKVISVQSRTNDFQVTN